MDTVPANGESAGSQSPVRYQLTPERIEELTPLLARFGLTPREGLWPRFNRALIHRSYRTEAGLDEDNERLEFLGDSVIGLAATEFILRQQPLSDEGSLSKLRATLVSRALLGEMGRQLGLGPLLLLGAGESRTGGRDRISILGSALEAICGALYLTYGWHEVRPALEAVVLRPAMESHAESGLVDFKSQLQEWTQKYHQQVPIYRVVSEGGPEHQKSFRMRVYLQDRLLGEGTGPRKKTAENDAAQDAISRLMDEGEHP